MPPFPVDPEKDTVCDVIRHWIARQPDAPVFLQQNEMALTFGGLGAVMDHMRDTLWSFGLGHGDRIAIVLPSGPDLASALFGVMGVCVPLPLKPDQTLEEFTRVFRENYVKALVVKEGLATPALEAAKGEGLLIMPVKRKPAAATGAIESLPMPGKPPVRLAPDKTVPGPNDIHLMVSTSGTTGKSRFTPRTNWRRIRHQLSTEKIYQLTPKDRYLSAVPLYYGGGIGQLIQSVLSGGSVAFLPNFEVEAFFRVLRDLGPTWYGSGPTVHRAVHVHLLAHPEAAEGSCLRFIVAMSAALEPAIADDLERFFSATVIENYSCNGRVSCNPLPPGIRKRGTVGLPVDCEVRIRSLDGEFLPAGEHGEILVKGGRLFGSEDQDSELHEADFIDGWFMTGDLGFFDEDGYLTLTGRIKEMINRGGEKVSPAQVDAALMGHPDVRDAATFPVPHPTLGEEVAAVVVLEPNSELNVNDLRAHLLERLSGFKMPKRIVFADDIPKSAVGKVQRHKLAEVFGVAVPHRPKAQSEQN